MMNPQTDINAVVYYKNLYFWFWQISSSHTESHHQWRTKRLVFILHSFMMLENIHV